jgi:nucleotide-binding universal stress UspA family protein
MADRSIVVGVDGTSTGLRAVAWAAREALLRGRPLRLVHAAPLPGHAG